MASNLFCFCDGEQKNSRYRNSNAVNNPTWYEVTQAITDRDGCGLFTGLITRAVPCVKDITHSNPIRHSVSLPCAMGNTHPEPTWQQMIGENADMTANVWKLTKTQLKLGENVNTTECCRATAVTRQSGRGGTAVTRSGRLY